MIFTPLEQFSINILIYCSFSFSTLNTVGLFLILISLILITVYFFGLIYNPTFIPFRLQNLLEKVYFFLLNLVLQQVGLKGLNYFSFFFFLFIFIAISNLIGLIPYSFNVTSQFAVTFILALSINFGLLIIGFLVNGIKFLTFFIPKGVPIFLLPLITVIEIFSYLIRTVSLSVRLFCNMTAGHTLLHIITSFSVLFLQANIYFPVIFVSLLLLAIYTLELGISLIQSYVFTILSAIYLNDHLNLGGH
jgi:F-type H+-transporting ATPase subunit a